MELDNLNKQKQKILKNKQIDSTRESIPRQDSSLMSMQQVKEE